MSTLKLPTPLPYDVVDELIDNSLDIRQDEIVIEGETMLYISAQPINGNRRNVGRLMMEVIEDYSSARSTEEGYHYWHGDMDAYEHLAQDPIDIQSELGLDSILASC